MIGISNGLLADESFFPKVPNLLDTRRHGTLALASENSCKTIDGLDLVLLGLTLEVIRKHLYERLVQSNVPACMSSLHSCGHR